MVDDVEILVALRPCEGGELLGRHRRHLRAVVLEPAADVGLGDQPVDLGIEAGHHLFRRSPRREDALPEADIEIADLCRFADGWHIGSGRRALRGRDRDELQRVRLDLRIGGGESGEEEIDVRAEQIVERGTSALVGHVGHVGFGPQLEQLAREVAGRPGAGRGECQSLRFRRLQHAGQCRIRRLLGNDQCQRHHGRERDRLQIFLRIVGKPLDPVLVDRDLRGLSDQQGVPVRRRRDHALGADSPAGTGPVVDHDRLPERQRELV